MIKFAAALFWFVGILFAIYAFMGLLIPAGLFVSLVSGEPITLLELSLMFLSFQIQCGYFIWIGWAAEVIEFKYPLRGRPFWIACAVHHLLWIIYLGIGEIKWDSFITGIISYLGIVVVTSIVCIFLSKPSQKEC